MIKITKVGTNSYGKWACFHFLTDLMEITGIAKTDLELEEDKLYTDLLLVVTQKNSKIYYNLVEKSK